MGYTDRTGAPSERSEPLGETELEGDVAAELIRAILGDDRETFDRLFDAWFAVLYAAAWQQTRSPALAEALARRTALDRVRGRLAQERARRPRRASSR